MKKFNFKTICCKSGASSVKEDGYSVAEIITLIVMFPLMLLDKSDGEAGLIHSSQNTRYSVQAKVNIVSEYLDGLGSLRDLCVKYHISSDTVLRNSIKKYNSHEPMKIKNSPGGRVMTSGRKTTFFF